MCVPPVGPRPTSANQTQESEATTRVSLTAPDISCGHCARTVTGALTALEGVTDVGVDIAARRITVAYDPSRVDVEQMQGVLREEGYPATTQPTPA